MEGERVSCADREVKGVQVLTVMCVLRSGGIYTPEWVRKLRDAVERNIVGRHKFVCLSDVEVPCERIDLAVDWPSWWGKIAMFRPGVIDGPTLYFDLDTVITGPVDPNVPHDFAMLQSFWKEDMVGSGVMWFSGQNVPHNVYTKFVKQPKAYMAHYERNKDGPYVGDQAFIHDTLNKDVPTINDHLPGIKSYKMHCHRRLPADARIICFHGVPRPSEVKTEWMEKHWR
mgnify:CR=1 FL=1